MSSTQQTNGLSELVSHCWVGLFHIMKWFMTLCPSYVTMINSAVLCFTLCHWCSHGCSFTSFTCIWYVLHEIKWDFSDELIWMMKNVLWPFLTHLIIYVVAGAFYSFFMLFVNYHRNVEWIHVIILLIQISCSLCRL